MTVKCEGCENEALSIGLYDATLDGCTDESGTVDAPVGWFALVEDYNGPGTDEETEGADWIVREDGNGFVTIEGPFDAIDFGTVPAYSMRGGSESTSGYVQPARVRFDELDAAYSEWMGDDEGADR